MIMKYKWMEWASRYGVHEKCVFLHNYSKSPDRRRVLESDNSFNIKMCFKIIQLVYVGKISCSKIRCRNWWCERGEMSKSFCLGNLNERVHRFSRSGQDHIKVDLKKIMCCLGSRISWVSTEYRKLDMNFARKYSKGLFENRDRK